MTAKHVCWSSLTLSAILLLVGCGGGVPRCYPVSGSVTVQGRPAVGAIVILHPEGGSEALQKLRPYGTVDEFGKFQLNCNAPGDGAPAGNYKVTIVWEAADADPVAPASTDPEAVVMVPDRLGGKYSKPESTSLRATVDSRATELPPFQL
ncbi:MAG TPA: hypothetical protein VL096_11720 [Pirellulaceae bacterium]|nr:hypothetical protein [Pirellulaceae bacterium]